MARATRLPWLAVLAAPCMLSCTLLVQFHDQPAGPDGGGGENDGGPPPSDGAPMDMTPPPGDAGPDTEMVDVAEVDTFAPCSGKQNGWYCGNNGLDDPLPDADLVYCDAGGIGSLTMCEAGCLHVVDPFPDSCNPCGGQANGDYCGRDLSGFNPDNADILIGCTGGQVGLQDACVHGCGSNGKMSACYP
ncbi:MAG TPA: hypothetical protein VF765_26395 [Polyangiaceae bacterium]